MLSRFSMSSWRLSYSTPFLLISFSLSLPILPPSLPLPILCPHPSTPTPLFSLGAAGGRSCACVDRFTPKPRPSGVYPSACGCKHHQKVGSACSFLFYRRRFWFASFSLLLLLQPTEVRIIIFTLFDSNAFYSKHTPEFHR